jgi:hypothetical protein
MNIALPLFGMIAGASPPLFLVSFDEGSSEDKMLWTMWATMCCYVYVGCKKLAPKYPAANTWLTDTTAGATVLMFASTLCATTLAVLYALLPINFWIKISVGVLISIHACYLVFFSDFYKEKIDGNRKT